MPYKDPERKRQWEQDHREQRNARRRVQPQAARSGGLSVPKPTHDLVTAQRSAQNPEVNTVSDHKPKSAWKVVLGWMVGIAVVLIAATASVSLPTSGNLGGSTGSGNSGA